MNTFLLNTVILLALVVALGYLNEKVTGFPDEIALMMFSIAIGGVLVVLSMGFQGTASAMELIRGMKYFDLEKFLMEGVLCFMLFAGSCHMRLLDFKTHARTISLLAVGATFLGAVLRYRSGAAGGKL